ncbi:MAG: DUF6916 family protein [Burkholderiaceae bacterium]
MNKREFVAGSVGMLGAAAVVPSASAREAVEAAAPARASWLVRTRERPDLAEHAGADAFEAYVGERFTVADGAARGSALVLRGVARVARCAATEQFDVEFAPEAGAGAPSGLVVLEHATGQRLPLHLEATATGAAARFNLLVRA